MKLILFFRNLFSRLPFTEWGLFLPIWLGLIFCEANCVTVLSWDFDKTLAYSHEFAFECYPNGMTTKSLFILFWAVIITRNKTSVPDINKVGLVIWSKIQFYKVLVIYKTWNIVATTYQLKPFRNG